MRATRESPSAKYAKSTATESRNIQFATAGRTEMLTAGNVGDWHAAVGEVLWELGTEDTDEQSRQACAVE